MATVYRTLILAVLVALTACGGGDWTEEDLRKDGAPPNCEAQHEGCR